MSLTLDQKFEASKPFWTEQFVKSIQKRLDAVRITATAEDVLRQLFVNCYKLMEEIIIFTK